MDDFLDFLKLCGIAMCLVIVLMVVAVTPLYFALGKECRVVAAQMQRPYLFGFWGGCMVQTKGGEWVKLENYRVVIEDEK